MVEFGCCFANNERVAVFGGNRPFCAFPVLFFIAKCANLIKLITSVKGNNIFGLAKIYVDLWYL